MRRHATRHCRLAHPQILESLLRLGSAGHRSPNRTARTPRHFSAWLFQVSTLGLLLAAVGCDDSTASSDPSVTAISPASADGQAAQSLTLIGQNLRGQMQIVLEDENGQALLPPIPAAAAADGQAAEATLPAGLPPFPEGRRFIKARVRVRMADGREVRLNQPIRLGEPENRSFDGSDNNAGQPRLGSAGTTMIRLAAADYADGVGALAGPNRLNPRTISNSVCAQNGSVPAASKVSDMFWQWGQFLDHDLDFTPTSSPAEDASILVPTGDPQFDPFGTGTAMIGFSRSEFDSDQSPRQQFNSITAFIDASQVYGSDAETAESLRMLDGTGRLKVSSGDLLPLNDFGFFEAGDIRVNEQLGLTAMHVLFLREHNRLCGEIAERHPEFTDEQIYQAARRIVGAELQLITYREFLPLLLGRDAIRPYRGYRPDVNPSIANEFATAAYRFGHSMLSSHLARLGADLQPIAEGNLALRDAFFQPQRLITEGGISPIIRGLAVQSAQELDVMLVDDVRNFLFGPPGAGGLDLASLNIQRGRDHGLPAYNKMRMALGLAPRASFAEVSSSAEVQARLAAAYASVDDIDLWVGGLAEDHRPGAVVGETVFTILRNQFERLRDGDRLWHELVLAPEELRLVRRSWLIDVIRRNTDIGDELERDVWHIEGARQRIPGGPGDAADAQPQPPQQPLQPGQLPPPPQQGQVPPPQGQVPPLPPSGTGRPR